jgi:CubicO group peptidase (beta-lactamase class C family)
VKALKFLNNYFNVKLASVSLGIALLLGGLIITTSITTTTITAASAATNDDNTTSSSFAVINNNNSSSNISSATGNEQQQQAASSRIPPPVKDFILNQIVNKSKSAIVVGFVDPNGTSVYSFGNFTAKGENDNNNASIPANENTIFRIGSITKTFTTLLLADMVKQGTVKLDDPIEKYLPANVKVPEYNGKKITLEDLATHTSGLPEWPSNIWVNNEVGNLNANYTADQLYQALSNTTLTREPGSKFQYSSFGLGLLGHILSLKAGMPYEKLVNDRILSVLGMNDTKITLTADDIQSRFPIGHENGKEIPTPAVPEVIAGAGAYKSTASDMLKYVSANLGLIHTKLDDAMELTHLIRHGVSSASPMNYSGYAGLGWRISTNFGIEVFTHSGALNGWNAFVGYIPAKHIGLVLLCNCDTNDADMNNVGFVLLHVAGPDTLTAKTEAKFHTTPELS